MSAQEMKAKEVHVVHRKYIVRIVEELRRGVMTFEYLNRRHVHEKHIQPSDKKKDRR